MNLTHTALIVAAYAATSAGSALAAPIVVASFPADDIDVPSTGATATITASGIAGPVDGFGITGLWTGVVRDDIDGIRPWPLDFGVTVTGPNGGGGTSPAPWFGDRSIVDYPVGDGFDFPGTDSPNGTWTIDLDSGNPAPWVAGLRNVTYHLLQDTDAEFVFSYTDNTQQGNSWNRPFFIAGISGLGPVDYQVLEFTVSASGLYEFESDLASESDHFTFLYQSSFDDTQPLANLVDTGLGNGNSPFPVPRGESDFEQLLFTGTTYFWVTSQWARTSAFSDFTNTITGPGDVQPAASPCNVADLAAPFGFVDLTDVDAFIAAFTAGDPAADIAIPFGFVDLSDVDAFIAAFLTGCP
ncbi:MAG: GC-type dockerin domain-anchored protein [Planctomycetota bacterium]